MMRIALPIVLLIIAVASFVVYTNPTYQTIKTLGIEESSYNEALTRSREVQEVRNKDKVRHA